ncbi:MAG: 8-oxoguanine deaminase [Anaerolineae bacterium]
MSTLLLKHIHTLITHDAQRREIHDGALFVRDGVIEAVGTLADMPQGEATTADEVFSLPQHIIMPGLVNTHHHMYQSLTRCIAQDLELFGWLKSLYPIWANLRSNHVHVSAKLAMAELILSGCTTSSDHLYIYPNDVRLEDEITAAAEIGMRFHAARGAMSVEAKAKAACPLTAWSRTNPPSSRIMQRVVETFHDAKRHAMLRVVIAPCSPFSVSRDLMREAAVLARHYGVHLHTHLAENDNDISYGLQVFKQRPGEYAEDVGWVGHDVWHAHCVKLDDSEIALFGKTGTGVCHCPSSNMRLASGIAPLRKMLDARVKVGLGVDGSASNDAAHLLNEARQAMLLQRVNGDPAALSAREALEVATLGGAAVLGRDDIGALAVGMSADFVGFRTDTHAFAGALHDAVAALVFCASPQVDLSVINGRVVVRDGVLQTLDLPMLVEQHNKLSRQLIDA